MHWFGKAVCSAPSNLTVQAVSGLLSDGRKKTPRDARARYKYSACRDHEGQISAIGGTWTPERTRLKAKLTMPWKNVDSIIEGRLFLGNIIAARSPRSLSERRISHIVSVCEDPIPADSPASGIRHLRIPVPDVDYADLLVHLPTACSFIHQALKDGGIVLVHCEQGLSRSATVVAAYLMYSQRIRATEALERVRRAREQVWPLPGFQEQLILFELCQYNPTTADGIYRNWRSKIERQIREGRVSSLS